jgi:hypothetical protein
MDREKVIRAWECCNPFNRKCNECPYEKDCYHDGISRHMVADAVALLKEQEAVVRCKDCKHSTVSESGLIKCGHVFRMADFFCADGERK